MSAETEMNNERNEALIINESTRSNNEVKINTSQKDSSLLNVETSTSTENTPDMMTYVNSITPDLNFDEKEPSGSNEIKINTAQKDSSLLIVEPSTSTENASDLMTYVNSITPDLNFDEKEPARSNEIKINTSQKDSSLLNVEPSTSTENTPDIMTYVNSITADLDFDEEERKLKEFEEKFMKMIKNETIDAPSPLLFDVSNPFYDELRPEEPINFADEREEEEIDVVNGTLDEINNLLRPETNEITESTEIDRTDPVVENGEEEIDVVNLPANEVILNLASASTTEILNITPTRKETNSHKRARTEMTSRDILHEIENAEEVEIDVVTNCETPKRRAKRNRTRTSEDEIIDVVNLTDDTPDYETLSTALVNSNRSLDLRSKRKLRSESNVIDLVNMAIRDNARENVVMRQDVIEITDSPVAPIVISGVITVDDDDHTTPERTSTWGNCPVCLEDLGKCEIMSTMCGHVYCASCIKTVIKTTKKCPKCRKNLTLKSIHPLFFN